jgi:hypothetical protein
LDKANPKGLNPLANLAQQGLKAFRGENLNEQDELYAKIVDDSYLADRPDRIEDYVRVPEFDSEYVSLWETSEGHRFIAVRGTKPTHMRDLGYDAEIAAFGRVHHDVVGAQLQRILDSTSPGVTVDVGGHSLGTALILRAFKQNADLKPRPADVPVQPRVQPHRLPDHGCEGRHHRLREGPARPVLYQPGRRGQHRRPGPHGPRQRRVQDAHRLGHGPERAQAAPVAGALRA